MPAPEYPADTTAKPWHRQAGEPLKAYAYFEYFLYLGKSRTVTGTAAHFKRSIRLLHFHVDKWTWWARAEAYDRYMEAQDAQLWEEQRREARKRQMQYELQRQENSSQVADIALRLITQFQDFNVVVEKTDREGKRAKRVDSAGCLLPLAVMMREYVRVSRAAVADVVEERLSRFGKEEEGPLAGRKVAGTFAVGDRMWDGQEPPNEFHDRVRRDGADSPDSPAKPVEKPVESLDVSGTEGLYPQKQ